MPAKAIRRAGQLGTLAPGAPADVAVFEIQEGDHEFADVRGVKVRGAQRLVNTLTISQGHEMPRDRDPGIVPAFGRRR